ncbi:MAG TPA: hypothetical protein VIG99_24340 [Myxococcaceae bacterium]|jgi:hypothetical protein
MAAAPPAAAVPALDPPAERVSPADRLLSGEVVLPAFVLFQFACQLLLITSVGGAVRVVLRSVMFVASIALFVGLRRHRVPIHDSARVAVWVLILLGAQMLHPDTNGALSGAGHWALYFAILGPLFWVPRLKNGPDAMRRLITVFWLFHTTSCAVAVLQVIYPGQFQPHLSTAISGMGEGYVNALQMTTSTGELVFRPMGLTDTPGGAGVSGVHAALFGVGVLFGYRPYWIRGLALTSVALGMVSVYLSQVRLTVVVLALSLAAAGVVFMVRRGVRWMAGFVTAVALMGSLAYGWAVGLAGDTVSNRLETLTEEDPRQVYYKNRGVFFEYTVEELIPRFPLGAGLGRWGMINAYLGKTDDPERTSLWAEIQLTGWVYDGGILMIAAYGLALLLAMRQAVWIAVRAPFSPLWIWGAMLFAYDVGALAMTFSYPVFIGQAGMEFWLFNAALVSAAVQSGLMRARDRRPTE